MQSTLGFSADFVVGQSFEIYTQNIDTDAHGYRLTFKGFGRTET